MGRIKVPKPPNKYNHGGVFGHKPVEPAAGNTSEGIVAFDVEPAGDKADDAGPGFLSLLSAQPHTLESIPQILRFL